MTFEGDDEAVEIPEEMLGGDDEAVLAPVFVGHRMEAELIRSLLEANEIPAVVFGSGGFAYGAEDVGPNERVMVRSDQVDAALEAIRTADVPTGEVIEPTEDDLELVAEEGYEIADEEAEDDAAGWGEPDVEVLAGGSDWGPRIVGLVGVAALIVAAVVLISKAS